MKYLLTAVNASYSHTNIAVRSLCKYVQKNLPSEIDCSIDFAEFTINQPIGEILRGIYQQQPDFLLFSTYIWNAEIINKILPDIKKLLPNCKIGAGGPEYGFASEIYLNQFSQLDFIIKGEGEATLLDFVVAMETKFNSALEKTDFEKILWEIKGIYCRKNQEICFTGERPLICDLSELPFPYPELEITKKPENSKIYYYESSRGCPYSCSYCMSSLDKRVRFMPLPRVFNDLQIFLESKVPLVKFVDRTYNLQPDRYIAIWKYILENHNGITMFHFEIEAEYLSPEALRFLQSVPSGVMQFEIGVQSSNKKTLAAVSRSTNVEKLAENVKQIPRTIHQHLDLIAGLPYEDLESFGRSFDFVMAMSPDALQLGFLKVLHGTQMEAFAKENNWHWMENPAYETFSTPYLSYSEILFLKDVEILVDAYYNAHVFNHLMPYINRKLSYWDFFQRLAKKARSDNVFNAARRETFWFEYLNSVCCDENTLFPELNSKIVYELLRYDFILRGKQGGYPLWYKHIYDKNRHRELLEQNGGVTNARLDFAHSEYEVFSCDVTADIPENRIGTFEKLIRYQP